MGALLSWASSTIWTICWRVVFIPTLVTSTFRAPSLFTVPPMTWSPTRLETGMLSPVTMLSSTEEAPSTTSPSRGTFSPGLTMRTSKGMTVSTGTSSSFPSSPRTRATGGWRSRSLRTASDALPLAISSRSFPTRMRARIRAAVSK